MTHAAGAGRAPRLSAVTLACCVFALLVAGSVVAVFYAQELKREVPLVNGHGGVTSFPTPRDRDAHFHLKVSVNDVLDIAVVTANGGQLVQVIARDRRVSGYQKFELTWNGRTADGAAAAPGDYSVRVRFERHDRTVIVPGFQLVLRSRVR